MSSRRTAVLAGVLLILALYFALFEGFTAEHAAPEWQRAEKMLDCGSGPPRELAVAARGGTVTARLVHERWESDAEGLAPLAFGALAEALCRLPVIDRIAEGAKLADYGLDPPAAKITIGLGGRRRTLLLGAATPAANLMYAKFDDQPDVLKIGVELKSDVERVAILAKGVT